MRFFRKDERRGKELTTNESGLTKKVGRTIRIVFLMLVAGYLLYRTFFFVNGMRYFVAVHKTDKRLVYKNVEYVETPFSTHRYDVGEKLGTVRGKPSDWPVIFLFYPFRWNDIYSVEGDDEERLLAVRMLSMTTLYCRSDIKEKLKKKGEEWEFAVGDVTGIKLESHTEGSKIITDDEQVAYLLKALNTRGQGSATYQDRQGAVWLAYYSYQDLPLHNLEGGIMESGEGTYVISDFDKDTGDEKYYKFMDDGRLGDIIGMTR